MKTGWVGDYGREITGRRKKSFKLYTCVTENRRSKTHRQRRNRYEKQGYSEKWHRPATRINKGNVIVFYNTATYYTSSSSIFFLLERRIDI